MGASRAVSGSLTDLVQMFCDGPGQSHKGFCSLFNMRQAPDDAAAPSEFDIMYNEGVSETTAARNGDSEEKIQEKLFAAAA